METNPIWLEAIACNLEAITYWRPNFRRLGDGLGDGLGLLRLLQGVKRPLTTAQKRSRLEAIASRPSLLGLRPLLRGHRY